MARKKDYPENILHDLKVDGVTERFLNYEHLTPRELAVIQMYYIENELPLKEIAKKFGVSDNDIMRIVHKALRKIRYEVKKKKKEVCAESLEVIMKLVCETCHWPYVEPDEDSLKRRCEVCKVDAEIRKLAGEE